VCLVAGAPRTVGESRGHGTCRPLAGLDAKKKTLAAKERDEAARATWRAAISQRDPHSFVFVDESGTHTALTRLYGWAPRHQRAIGIVPRNHGKNTTLVAALSPHGLQAPWAIEGAIDTKAFERYISEVLGPTLHPGQVVIMDNLSVHKGATIRHAIEARQCELLFLPAYSPDFTPSELAFSKIKAFLRKVEARAHDALLDAIEQAVDLVTRHDAHSWFAHAGYPLPALSP
jgi:transposase